MTSLSNKFKSNSLITAFKEFALFTKITALNSTNTFEGSSITSIVLPLTVTQLAYMGAFRSCSKLSGIYLHEGIVTVGTYSFGSTKMAVIEFPESLASLGNWFCQSCSCKLIFKNPTPPTGVSSSEANNRSFGSGQIYVPDEAVDEYKTKFTSIASRIHPISDYVG